MIGEHHTGGGCMAYEVIESDAPGLYALITESEHPALPNAPETDTMSIGVYSDVDNSEALSLTMVTGRAGLLDWYKIEVGYSPDEDIGGQTPILELMDRVASHLLLRAHAALEA